MVAAGRIAALSMGAIAREMRYANGTIHNHLFLQRTKFCSRWRSRVPRLGYRSFISPAVRVDLAKFDGGDWIACEDFRNRFADLLAIETLVRHATIWEKASDRRPETLMDCESRTVSWVASVDQQAIEAGDLSLPGEVPRSRKSCLGFGR
ncbi:hypothetical protein Poly59_09780 [Rubripirellula reticaptiva]|uniref:Uncharacterized protein n=1 Tax=Rubripirellula reticaptiva TaxID=2528013 RepID=A0A5C6FEL5_9BACT|nr:hypothetical protein Poly59_09780 [Rubripirellula reticaptiva]